MSSSSPICVPVPDLSAQHPDFANLSDPATWGRLIEWAARESFCCPLPPRTRFLLQGADAFRYLNGQSSNDLGRVREDMALPTCLLTVKGRIVSVPWVWRADAEAFCLEVPASMAEATAARLDRYLVADAVEITSADAPVGWHVSGAAAPPPPPGSRSCARFGQPGYDTEIPPGAESPGQLSAEEAEVLRVLLGLPDEPEWHAEVFPAEIGLDRTAVDFHKGCYPGQEVVSRLQSVGQARRTLVRWWAEIADQTSHTSLSGCPLRETPDGRDLGLITSCLPGPGSSTGKSGHCAFGLALVRVEVLAENASRPVLFALPENTSAVEIHLIP